MVRTRWAGPCWALAVALIFIVATVCSARGAGEIEFLRRETVGEKTVRLGLTTSPATYEPIIYRIPGQEEVRVVAVGYDPESDLTADIYYPPIVDLQTLPEVSLPVVIFPMGFSAERFESYGRGAPKDQPLLFGWATLFAMQGAVAVVYDVGVLDEGFHRLFEFLTDHEAALGLDLSRIGIWATSGHGKFASIVLGYPDVAPAIRAVQFVNADPRPTTTPEGDIAFYVVYSSDGDRWERIGAALARRLEIQGTEVIVDSTAPYKGFSQTDPTPESIEIVRKAVVWMRNRLSATPVRAD